MSRFVYRLRHVLRYSAAASLLLVMLIASTSPGVVSAKTMPVECEMHSLPSFVAQPAEAVSGYAKADDVADIVQVYCNDATYAEKTVTLEDPDLANLCHKNLKWTPAAPHEVKSGAGYETELDADGNSTVVMFGEECAAGSTKLVLASPLTTKTLKTTFRVLPAKRSKAPEGVVADPSSGIENTFSSGAATILEATFPTSYAGKEVGFSGGYFDEQCEGGTAWFGGGNSSSGVEYAVVDKYGRAFAVASGENCVPGEYQMLAYMIASPYAIFETTFTAEPPRPVY